jgi:hypothetical protein
VLERAWEFESPHLHQLSLSPFSTNGFSGIPPDKRMKGLTI